MKANSQIIFNLLLSLFMLTKSHQSNDITIPNETDQNHKKTFAPNEYFSIMPDMKNLSINNQLEEIILNITEENNKNEVIIGLNGTIYFITDFYDNENIFNEYIEQNRTFITNLTDNYENNYEVKCKLFNPTNEKLRIFCNLNETLLFTEQNVTLNLTSFSYTNYSIIINSRDPIKVKQFNYYIPFLYSQSKTINFEYSQYEDIYVIKFNSEKYNGEKLFLKGNNSNFMIFDNIKLHKKEISCFINKSELQKLLIINLEQFKLGSILDNYGTYYFDNVFPITLNCTIKEKENITITSLELINNVTEVGSTFTYKTDVYETPEFVTMKQIFVYLKKEMMNLY